MENNNLTAVLPHMYHLDKKVRFCPKITLTIMKLNKIDHLAISEYLCNDYCMKVISSTNLKNQDLKVISVVRPHVVSIRWCERVTP
jgi:hypothetical protein